MERTRGVIEETGEIVSVVGYKRQTTLGLQLMTSNEFGILSWCFEKDLQYDKAIETVTWKETGRIRKPKTD